MASEPNYYAIPAPGSFYRVWGPVAGGEYLFQRYDGHCSGMAVWKTPRTTTCPQLAADWLAVAEGRMTKDEQAKREVARYNAKKRAERKARAA